MAEIVSKQVKEKFDSFRKTCKFKTYQDHKCVNDKNPKNRLVGSCAVELCPLRAQFDADWKPKTSEPAGAGAAAGAPNNAPKE